MTSCATCWSRGWVPARSGWARIFASATTASATWRCCKPCRARAVTRCACWMRSRTATANACRLRACAARWHRAILRTRPSCWVVPSPSAAAWCAASAWAISSAIPPPTSGSASACRRSRAFLQCGCVPVTAGGRAWPASACARPSRAAASRCWKPTCSISTATCTASASKSSSSPSCATRKSSPTWMRCARRWIATPRKRGHSCRHIHRFRSVRVSRDYKQTINLPQTAFAMKADLAKREPAMLADWESAQRYVELQQRTAHREHAYILHDGPPYANGKIHLGHAVNKILKDIVVRSKLMAGFRSPYVPGWDCHGLPIEIAVEKKYGKVGHKIDAEMFRQHCREYAAQQIDVQRHDFKRLGVLGDWEHPYRTMDFKYEADILRALAGVYANGHVTR